MPRNCESAPERAAARLLRGRDHDRLALSLFVGGELAEGGVDWRVNFGISAAIGFASLPFLFGGRQHRRDRGHPDRRLGVEHGYGKLSFILLAVFCA